MIKDTTSVNGGALPKIRPTSKTIRDRRQFIGGSDARIIRGGDEARLLRLWREKRGELEPEDLSQNLIVQLGTITEDLNRTWYERNTGNAVEDIQRRTQHPIHKMDGRHPRWPGA